MEKMPTVGYITAIKTQKRKNRRSIFIDEIFSFGVDAEIVHKYKLTEGQFLDAQLIEKIVLKEEYRKACNRVFNFIAYCPRSLKEVKNYLSEFNYPPIIIARVIEKCVHLGYLDDKELVLLVARAKLRRKPQGAAALHCILQKKGFEYSDIKAALGTVYSEKEESAYALQALESKFKAPGSMAPEKLKTRAVAFLQRRGFCWDSIREAIGKSALIDYQSDHD